MSGEPGIKRTGSHFDEIIQNWKNCINAIHSSLKNALAFTEAEFSPALRPHYVS